MAPADLDYVVVDVTGNMWAGPFASEFEAAGLITGKLELSPDGKALNYFEVTKFALTLTPVSIAKATASLPNPPVDAD
ncbi:MAG: hypothetical protein ACRD6W_13335 [Nitrososphaerales archaeon]